jgi:3-phenylpropionate/cinnamic acid dioxygenase small subunit
VSDAAQITNLLYRYAELMDAGDLLGAATLFAKARVKTGGGASIEGSQPLLELWQAHVKIYPCGTPRTRHMITNAIVEIDEAGGTATCRSCYTVYQATPDLPFQAICGGRYHDVFSREDGNWHFSGRDYSMLDFVGDLSQHLLIPVAA